MNHENSNFTPAGYAWLIRRYSIAVPKNWHESYVSAGHAQRIVYENRTAIEYFPKTYLPENTLGGHLEFALKYDGVNLAILAALFKKPVKKVLLKYIREKPTGKYARRIWFLYEFLTGEKLSLPDLDMGGYVDLLDKDTYYTAEPGRKSRRHRINDNLPGNADFCALVRKTDALTGFEAAGLDRKCKSETIGYPPELLKRALGYLYAKETKTSFEIERVTPGASKAAKFAAALALAETEDFVEKRRLIKLQNIIADDRFREKDYRTVQNYIGESASPEFQKIHYVCPKPEDVPDLMDGLISAHNRLPESDFPAVIHAAIVSFGFVFIHPFEDGNGRIHRFLLHNILALRGFTPKGILFPISPAILKRLDEYDAALESFSELLLPHIEYTLDDEGRMTVSGETACLYKYMDLTAQAESLFAFLESAIEDELKPELEFLAAYDRARAKIRRIIDMPAIQVKKFIRLCLQGGGRISKRHKERQFGFLSIQEIDKLEKAVQSAFNGESGD